MRKGTRIGMAAAALAAAGAMIVPASSSATVTVGSNLQRAPQLGVGCAGSCTFALSALDQAFFAAPNGVRSPTNGTIVRWRIRTGASSTPTALRVVRPSGTAVNQYFGQATSDVVTPPTGLISEHQTSLPIKTGDLIGVDCCNPGTGTYFRISDGDSLQWSPTLGTGSRAPNDDEGELLVNADIEPDNTFTLSKAKAKKGKVKFTANVPNAGGIVAGDPKDKKLGAGVAAAAAKRPPLLTRYGKRVGTPGEATLSIRLSKSAQKTLTQKGKLNVRVRIVYTPDFGTPSARTLKAKFVKK